MDQRRVLTAGYTGRDPADLLLLAQRHDLIVVDVRFSPRSRQPSWNRGQLERLLGDRYLHLPDWGNTRYKLGPPVEITDLPHGLAVVKGLGRVPALLCVCSDPTTCHRAVLADALRAEGWEVSELDWLEANDALPDSAQSPLPIPGEGTGGAKG